MVKILTKANYLAEGQWKCSKSPTGAHHWDIVSRSMTCRHCALVRETGNVKIGASAAAGTPAIEPGLD